MPDVRKGEPVVTGKTIFGFVVGIILGYLVLPDFWAPLLGIFNGIEWIIALISFGIFLLGYKLIKYTEGAPDILGAVILMLGFTLLVFSVWDWFPLIALPIPINENFPYITIGLIVGSAAFLIGIILIKKYATTERHLNDIGEVVGLMYGGFMIYMWFADVIMVPLLKNFGINLIAIVNNIQWPMSIFV